MAGKYQHYLQQMLQRGFKRKGGSKKHPSVWVYKKDEAPYYRRIEKFGGDDEFYSEVSNGFQATLDDKITDWESHRQADVRKWRTFSDGQVVEAEKAAELVSFTGVRTNALRQTFRSVIGDTIPKFAEALRDPDVLMNHIENNEKMKSGMRDMLLIQMVAMGHSIEKIEPTPEFKAINRMMNYAMTEVAAHALSTAFRDVDRAFQELLNSDEMDLEEMHKRALEKRLDNPEAREDLLSLHWTIARKKDAGVWVLPDSAILEFSQDNQFSQFLFTNSADRKAVILPLASDCALIGRTSSEAVIDLTQLNAGAAACSLEFFVAAENSDALSGLSANIGTSVDEGVRTKVSGALEAVYDLSSSKTVTPPERVASLNFQRHNLVLSEVEFHALASTLMPHFYNVSGYFDLTKLSKIIISADIQAAYNEIVPDHPIQLDEEDLRRDVWWLETGIDEPTYTLFLSYAVVTILADSKHESFDFAYELFMQALAQLHVRAVITDDASKNGVRTLYLNEDIGVFIKDISTLSVCTFMDTLYGLRIVQADLSYLPDWAVHFVEAIETYFGLELPDTDHPETNNLRAQDMSDAMRTLMHSGARYCALCQHLGVSVVDTEQVSDVAAALAKYNLSEWLVRLDFDYQRLRVNFFSPLEPTRVHAIQLHTERLFWGRGAIFIPMGDQGWIRPHLDKTIDYEFIRKQLETFVLAVIPENVSDNLLNAFKLHGQKE